MRADPTLLPGCHRVPATGRSGWNGGSEAKSRGREEQEGGGAGTSGLLLAASPRIDPRLLLLKKHSSRRVGARWWG